MRDLVFDLAYVGSQTRALAVSKGINEISAADQSKGAAYLQATVANPFAGLLPGTGINGATVQRQQLLRPYPQFTGITQNSMSIGKSWYHSMQMRVERRMARGFSLISSYTLSKNMEQNNFLNAQDSVMVRQLTDFDRTHRWVVSGVYDLPFGRGERFGGTAGGLVGRLIGGWQVNWIFTQQSGRPLDQPDLERIGSARLDDPTPDRWFNTCYQDTSGALRNCLSGEAPVWYQRAPFTLRTTPNRFADIRVPWKPTLDFSVFKTTRIREGVSLRYHLETFNTFNSVIFPAPSTSATSANFGKIAEPRGSVYFPRNIQMALKLYF
jgi:hypothetical protein